MPYLDNASTTPVSPEAADAASHILRQVWGNPSALYRAGMEAEAAIEEARSILAKALGCTPKEVFFTGSGTEANNIAIFGAARVRASWGNELVTTGYEHPSVSGPLEMLAAREGFTLHQVAPGADGKVDISELVSKVGPKTALVSAMQVNNETGATLDVATLAATVKAKNPRCFVHVDGIQGFCKLGVKPSDTKIDSYSLSGHKLHAPKGVGALYLRAGGNFVPLMAGGGQEADSQNRCVRPGTENTAHIAALGRAVKLASAQREATVSKVTLLKAALLKGLEEIPGCRVHSPQDAYPGTVFFSLPAGYRSEMMIHHLDEGFDVQVSSGSACHGGQPSHTLCAMGVPGDQIDTALRVSFSGWNTPEDVDTLLRGLKEGFAARAHGRPGKR
ncbi:cysteine desulfurase [Ruminococcaceae bacterium OttesenSCG-928-D13]|nr:cysteine desulfurase [Ruminococcaceae bacterium OttesenSCG-928-D13]